MPVDGGAVVMVCDETCFVAVANRLPAVEPMLVPELTVCCTCFACSQTVEGTRCPCARLEVSCGGPSWLLTSQAIDALDAIHDVCGATDLGESGWQQLLTLADQFWIGGVVGLMWVRSQQR